MIDLSGRVVLVTGGGAGLGLGIVQGLVRAGASVAVAEIDPRRVDALRTSLGDTALVEMADARDAGSMGDLAEKIDARFGGLDALVNNVGDFLGLAKPFEDFSDEEVEALYAVNLKSVFVTTRAAIPLLRKRAPGGSIVSVSSIEAFRGIPNVTAYSAFKHAITGFTRSLALELGPAGIRVNAIAPETSETPQVPVHAMIAPEHRDHIERWIPLGRFGTAEDAAGAALFLVSELSSWVTGTTINLDGGALAAGGWYRDPRGRWTNLPVVAGNGFNF